MPPPLLLLSDFSFSSLLPDILDFFNDAWLLPVLMVLPWPAEAACCWGFAAGNGLGRASTASLMPSPHYEAQLVLS